MNAHPWLPRVGSEAWTVLTYAVDATGIGRAELAESSGIAPGNLDAAMSRLRKAGLIASYPSAAGVAIASRLGRRYVDLVRELAASSRGSE